MNERFRFPFGPWLAVPVGACVFLIWIAGAQFRHAEFVAGLGHDDLKIEQGSPSGYAGGMRRLIVSEQNTDSYHWIMQTQSMLARHEWRVRHIDYENAPFGREASVPSPYRWWLGLTAWIDHAFSGRPLGQSVERAALWADPLAQLLLLLSATLFVAWRFGAFPATVLSAGMATLFPLAAGFLPGSPNSHSLSLACAIWSVLLLLAGMRADSASKAARIWFGLAGVAGGVGLWIDIGTQVPILGGIAAGALLLALITRKDVAAGALPWRTWALSGALTSFAAYLVEYFPDQLGSWQLRVNHPLYGLAWLGGGELLLQFAAWIRTGKRAWTPRATGMAVLGAVAFVALPIVMRKTDNPGFLATDLLTSRLTRSPDSPMAASFWTWLVHDGITPAACITALPLLLILPMVWLMFRRKTETTTRVSLAFALGPVLVAAGFAFWQLSWWQTFDGLLLVVLVAAVSSTAFADRSARWIGSAVLALNFALGAYQLMPSRETATALSEREAKALVERDLAHWLAKQVGPKGAIVLAPPGETVSFCYYGGQRGLATIDWENKDGFSAAVRIVSASTVEEAMELIHRREVTHIVLPSWDTYLDEFARSGLGQLEGSFIDRLHQWAIPPWLRPVPYQLPALAGFEGQSVVVLEVVEEQDPAAAVSRIAEYFVEMGRLDLAAGTAQSLRRFPADLGALVARAQVEIARGDEEALANSFKVLLPRLAAKADRTLPWDRRVSLAVVLARGKHADLAREQLRRCLAEIDEDKLRSLSTGALYRLMVLSKGFGMPVSDPRLHDLALDLLPADSRARLSTP